MKMRNCHLDTWILITLKTNTMKNRYKSMSNMFYNIIFQQKNLENPQFFNIRSLFDPVIQHLLTRNPALPADYSRRHSIRAKSGE